ncbi:MAG: CBM9 family sugar-binding protein [Saprospiraceae bacterium]|nr:CBM9 family sugar-binding protein [Saprospiraceae bacterium]
MLESSITTRTTISLLSFLLCLQACAPSAGNREAAAATEEGYYATQAQSPPVIDGVADDAVWQNAPWYMLDQTWIGEEPTAEDFSGRYKLAWDENFLYILAEIRDDTLIDIHPDGLQFYWDDDCLEVFVDEDASGGNHQYSHNAFAYHIALDYRVTDIGPDSLPRYYDDHIRARRVTEGNTSIWEVAVAVYPDTFRDGAPDNKPVKLTAGKVMGFALAYCDNDHSPERENFIGSTFVPGEDKNRGWIDAGIFAKLELRGASK